MTDPEVPVDGAPLAEHSRHRAGLVIGLGAAAGIVFIAMLTVVLIVALNVLGSTGLPPRAAQRALLTSDDLAKIHGVSIATGLDGEIKKHSLQAYVKANPGDTSMLVAPARCAANLEGWMAWKSLDTPAYKGWKADVIYESSNIVVDSMTDYENGLQETRHFVNVAAATAFMSAQRGWYKDCATTRYIDPNDSSNNATYAFSPIPLNLGLDSVIEGSTNKGDGLAPHFIDVYLRNQNIVYVTELVTSTAPQHRPDRVSLAILTAAAKKLAALR